MFVHGRPPARSNRAVQARQETPSRSGPELRGLSFAQGSAAVAPVQMRAAAPRAGTLSPVQVQRAVAYNRRQPIPRARWQTIQRQVGTTPDGIVGPMTVRAVAQWQARNRLAADGMVGPQTLARLGAGGGGAGTPAPSPGGATLLNAAQVNTAVRYNRGRGFSVAQVRTIQQKVGAAADGVIGPKTCQAVARFQRARGLAVDGKIGPQTQGALGVKPSAAAPMNGSNAQKLAHARQRAAALGLRITSTTGGRHAPNSYHYIGRAIDFAGSHGQMSKFYWEMHALRPTELFYDPIGGVKHGRDIGPIGGHGNHVHVAF